MNRFDDPRGRVWMVRYGNRWLTAKWIRVGIPTETIFRGRTATQPKAYLAGYGVARQQHGTIRIEAA